MRTLASAAVLAGALISSTVIVVLAGAVAAEQPSHASGAGAHLQPGSVPAEYADLIAAAAGTCPLVTAPVLAAQLEAESGWNPRVVSSAGAQGIAQFMPGTWATEGVDGDRDGIRDPFNPADAIPAQARFLCKLISAVTVIPGDVLDLALAAYNAGLGAVHRYRGIPPYPETEGYVAKIRRLIPSYTSPGAAVGAGVDAWVSPADGPLSSRFGTRVHPITGETKLHGGVDINVDYAPVAAANTGIVTAVDHDGGYGLRVMIDHGGGVQTLYAHLSQAHVALDTAVAAGAIIATSGNTGLSTGPHLHFEVRVHGQRIDPVAFYRDHGAVLVP